MTAKRKKMHGTRQPNGCHTRIQEALAAVSDDQWRNLARLAEHLLSELRQDPRMARYLAGVRGEEVVNGAVLAIHRRMKSPGKGRAVNGKHLQSPKHFLGHLEQIVKSSVNNFRRHQGAAVVHESIDDKPASGVLRDPPDSSDLAQEIGIADLFRVLIPRVFDDLRKKPKQLLTLSCWAESLGRDDILPAAGQSKFVRFCVRQAIIRQLKALAAADLKVDRPNGKELLM